MGNEEFNGGHLIVIIFKWMRNNKTKTGYPGRCNKTFFMLRSIFQNRITWILGYFNPDQLSRDPWSSWYDKGYADYQPDEGAIKKLLSISKDSLSIKVVMGTWCPDSRREVPRFMKIMDIWKFPVSKMTFIGVDNEKLSPVGEYKGWILNLYRHLLFLKIILKPDASSKILRRL